MNSRSVVLFSSDTDVLAYWMACVDELQTCSQSPAACLGLKDSWDGVIALLHLEKPEGYIELLPPLIEQGALVVVLVDAVDVDQGVALFRQGIKGYLEALEQPGVLIRAIELVKQGRVWLGQDIMSALITGLHHPKKEGGDVDAMPRWDQGLTDRERDVARGILAGQSNKTIADALCIAERTVKAHIHSLFQKKQVKDRLAFVLKYQASSSN